jgi:bifunctional DNA-binding transcriptional regulator/antitoxin component of YhaV-PrlF toxin-antitoxin module
MSNNQMRTTRVQLANNVSGSLRITIPNDIAEEMGLKVGDVVDWDTTTDKGRKYARIRKLE